MLITGRRVSYLLLSVVSLNATGDKDKKFPQVHSSFLMESRKELRKLVWRGGYGEFCGGGGVSTERPLRGNQCSVAKNQVQLNKTSSDSLYHRQIKDNLCYK